MVEMDLANLKVLALIPRICFWPFEKLRGLGRRGEILQDGNRLMAFCRIRILFPMLKVHCDSREDRRMLVATGSTDDEVFMISKCPSRITGVTPYWSRECQ
jgi:hypothetical protein